MHTVVDLFSGCGGLSLGFRQAGFKIAASYECWRPAADTYRANFSEDPIRKEIDLATNLPAADVIIGGPPCQGFSSAGRRSSDDDRNSLISVFASLIVHSRPKAFVFENVEGFLTLSDGRFVFELLDPLVSAGYRIHLRKVNAAHFGVPQHRKRIVAIGGLGWNPTFPEVTHSAYGSPGAERANGFNLPPSPSLAEAFQGMPLPRSSKDGRSDEYAHVYSPFSVTDTQRASRLKPGQTMRDLPEEFWHESYQRRANRRVKDGTATEKRGGAPAGLRRLVLSEPSKAITGGALRDFVHPTENRPLTIRECARIQTFPDSFVFHGTRSEQIQMIGNAVPVVLAQAIARSLLIDLGTKSCTEMGKGMLLSFVPTMSDGMSPVLERVVDRVSDSFKQRKPEQQSLWA